MCSKRRKRTRIAAHTEHCHHGQLCEPFKVEHTTSRGTVVKSALRAQSALTPHHFFFILSSSPFFFSLHSILLATRLSNIPTTLNSWNCSNSDCLSTFICIVQCSVNLNLKKLVPLPLPISLVHMNEQSCDPSLLPAASSWTVRTVGIVGNNWPLIRRRQGPLDCHANVRPSLQMCLASGLGQVTNKLSAKVSPLIAKALFCSQ